MLRDGTPPLLLLPRRPEGWAQVGLVLPAAPLTALWETALIRISSGAISGSSAELILLFKGPLEEGMLG